MLRWSNQSFKAGFVKMLHQAIMGFPETNNNNNKRNFQQRNSSSKQYTHDVMELSNALTEWKRPCIPGGPSPSAGAWVWPWSDSWDPKKTQPAQQSTCCLGSITEDKSSESKINQNCPVSTTERKERLKKKKRNRFIGTCVKIAEMPTFVPSGLRGEKKGGGAEKIWMKNAWKPLNTAKNTNLQLQGEEQKSNRKAYKCLAIR